MEQFNNFGTIHQLSTGDHATLIYNNKEEKDGTVSEEKLSCSPEEQALAVYLQEASRREAVIAQLALVTTAREIAFKVVASLSDLPNIDRYVVVKKDFINSLLSFTPNLTHGNYFNNVREQINKMVDQNKWKR